MRFVELLGTAQAQNSDFLAVGCGLNAIPFTES
jgi:hypothetical protein